MARKRDACAYKGRARESQCSSEWTYGAVLCKALCYDNAESIPRSTFRVGGSGRKSNASAGNRARATPMATMYSATRPLMLLALATSPAEISWTFQFFANAWPLHAARHGLTSLLSIVVQRAIFSLRPSAPYVSSCLHHMAARSSGMILASGARGPGCNFRSSPLFICAYSCCSVSARGK